jgi:hypothetical protein
LEEAKQAFAESLALRRAVGDRRGTAHSLETGAELAGDAARAGRLLSAAAQVRSGIGAPAPILDQQHRRDEGLAPGENTSLEAALEEAARVAPV